MSITTERIKLRLKEVRMNIDDLAPIVKKDRTTLYRYLNGSIEKIPVNTLHLIAQTLHTTPDYLMGWTDDPFGYESFDHAANRLTTEYNNMLHHLKLAGLTDTEISYVDKYHSLDDNDKAMINQMIERLFENSMQNLQTIGDTKK